MSRLKKERNAVNLSQLELARFAGVAASTVCKLEKNKTKRPGHDVLDRLASALVRLGRDVTARDLSPHRQPVLVKGARRSIA